MFAKSSGNTVMLPCPLESNLSNKLKFLGSIQTNNERLRRVILIEACFIIITVRERIKRIQLRSTKTFVVFNDTTIYAKVHCYRI